MGGVASDMGSSVKGISGGGEPETVIPKPIGRSFVSGNLPEAT
jgi:hypothetical protein